MSARNAPVDTLRGIACILLVTMHVIGHNATAGIGVADDSAFRWYTDSFTYLRMPLFSFLAGLVYAWRPLRSPAGYGSFMGKKVRRLLVPYVIFVPLIGIAQSIVPGANSPTGMPAWQWLIFSLSPYWFLLATFWIFAVVALADSYRLIDRLPIVLAAWVVLVAVNVLFTVGTFKFLQLGSALTLSTFFLTGMAVHRFGWNRAPLWAPVALGVVLVALFGYTQLGFVGIVPMTESRGDLVGILLGMAFPMVFLATRISSRALAWIGGYSSGIFLLHPFAVSGTRVLLERAGVGDQVTAFLIGSAVGIFGSILGVMLLRRLMVGRVVLGERARTSKKLAPAPEVV